MSALAAEVKGATLARFLLVVGAGLLLLLIWLVPPLHLALAAGAMLVVALTLRYPVAGLCLLAFSVPWGSGFTLPVSSFPISSTEVLVGALGVAWLVAVLYRPEEPALPPFWGFFLGLFLAAIVLSVSQAVDVRASAREIVKWLEMTVVYLAGCRFLRTRRDVEAVVAATVLAGVSEAILGYVQFAFHLGPEEFAANRLFLRAYGTFDQPNPFAGYLNLEIPLALTMGLIGARRGSRRLWLAAVVLMFGAILASESRGALLGALFACAVVLAFLSAPVARLVWAGVVSGVIAVWLALYGLVPQAPVDRVLSATGLGGVSFTSVTTANYSAVERAAHWLTGVRMFAAHPLLGVGIGNWDIAYPAYHPRGWYLPLEHAHNYYINIAAEAGIIGLTAYALLIGSALWYSYATLRRAGDAFDRAVVLGVLGALLATSLHNVFDVLYVHGMVALLGLLMALIAATWMGQSAATPTGE